MLQEQLMKNLSFATISNSMENELKYLYNKNIRSAVKLRS